MGHLFPRENFFSFTVILKCHRLLGTFFSFLILSKAQMSLIIYDSNFAAAVLCSLNFFSP